MKRRPNSLWIILPLTCTMCTSFPVILNLGGSQPKPEVSQAFSIVNWNNHEPAQHESGHVSETVWALEEIQDVPLTNLQDGYNYPTLTMKGGCLSGQSPCNGYSAPYTLDGTQFKIGSIQATMVYCKTEIMFFSNLNKADACIIAPDGKMYFLIGGIEALQFRMISEAPAQAYKVTASNDSGPEPEWQDPESIWLDDDSWLLEEINDAVIPEDDLPGPRPRLQFNANHTQLKGRSFCNPYSAPCTFYGNAFSIGKIANSWDYCEGEEAFYIALSTATGYMIKENTMYLLDGETEVLQFRRL